MENLIPSLVVVAVVGVLVGLIFWLVGRNKKKQEETMRRLASLNGWIYEPVNEHAASGYRLRKGEWTLEALNETTGQSSENSTSSNVSSNTRWFSESVKLPEGIVMIGPRQPEINLGGMGDVLMQAALRLMIGSDADQALGIHQIELGSLELMKRYMVWTNQDAAAEKLLGQTVENALLNLPGAYPLVVKFSTSGMEVKVQGRRLYNEQELYTLIKLGNALLDSAA